MQQLYKYLAVGLTFLLVGIGLGYQLYHGKAAAPETYAPEQRQADGSLVLERKPDASAAPAQPVPAGATVERVVKVTVQPTAKRVGTPAATAAAARDGDLMSLGKMPDAVPAAMAESKDGDLASCPPVHLDLTLAKLKDGSQRVIASSPDGEVTGGIDVPTTPQITPKALPWSLSALRTTDHRWGGLLQYERGPFTVGLGALPAAGQAGAAAFVSAGIRF